jgi:hypothetical protein
VSDFQRRQRELAAQAAEDQRRQPVDLQVGDSVFEDMPAEMRSRLYCVIARQPELVENLKVGGLACVGGGWVAGLLRADVMMVGKLGADTHTLRHQA